jgi:hypothetical protein
VSILMNPRLAALAVLRTMDPAAVKIAEGASLGASWHHASVVASYNDAELAAILEYLRAVIK